MDEQVNIVEERVVPMPAVPRSEAERRDRLSRLVRDREILDREIAWLTMDLGEDGRAWWTCARCGHNWQSWLPTPPRVCPKCKSMAWRLVLRPGQRKRGRPSKIDLARREREEKRVAKLSAPTTLPVVQATESSTSVSTFPPPPRSLSEELEARRVPSPRLPDPEPEPDAEPIEPATEPAPVESSDV